MRPFHHEAGHKKRERPQCQTHRWRPAAKSSQDPTEGGARWRGRLDVWLDMAPVGVSLAVS